MAARSVVLVDAAKGGDEGAVVTSGENKDSLQRPARGRIRQVVLALCVVAAGLLWRSGLLPMPAALADHGGDALWALMVFFGCGFLFPRASTVAVAALALGIAWAVEFSQLYRADWIDAARATLPGRLVLGTTFNWPDLPAYAAGVATGALAEWWWRRRGRA